MLNMYAEWMLSRLEMELRERRMARLAPLLAGVPQRRGLLRRFLRRLEPLRRQRFLALPTASRGQALGTPARRGRAAPVPRGEGLRRVRAGPVPRRRDARWRRCDARWPVDADRLPR